MLLSQILIKQESCWIREQVGMDLISVITVVNLVCSSVDRKNKLDTNNDIEKGSFMDFQHLTKLTPDTAGVFIILPYIGFTPL